MADETYVVEVPILDELILRWEPNHHRDDYLTALIGGILGYYFPVAEDYVCSTIRKREEAQLDNLIFCLQSFTFGDSELRDYAFIGGMNVNPMRVDRQNVSLDQLEMALAKELNVSLNHQLDSNDSDDLGRCWAMLFHQQRVSFYEYHDNLPGNRLIQWVETGDGAGHTYHVHHESDSIDRMLRHMFRTREPAAREGRRPQLWYRDNGPVPGWYTTDGVRVDDDQL